MQDKKPYIIDIHTHVAGIGDGRSGCLVSDNLRNSYKYGIYLKAFGVTEAELKEHGDGLTVKRLSEKLATSREIDAAIVLAMDGVIDATGSIDTQKTELYIPNDFILHETAKYPNLFFGASINPYRRDAITLLHQYAAEGAHLIKWIPSIMDIDPADSALIPFYQTLVELGLPLLTHAGKESSFTWARDELADPERLMLPLSLGVTVIAAHAGAGGESHGAPNHERLQPLFMKYPNLYADLSALTQVNRIGHLAKVLACKSCAGNYLYGSDYPLIETSLVSPWYAMFRIKWKELHRIRKLKNVWDQDVGLKRALGMPEDVFLGAGRLFPRVVAELERVEAVAPVGDGLE